MDYSEKTVKQVILAGMCDDKIMRKILSTTGRDHKSLNNTIALIETEDGIPLDALSKPSSAIRICFLN